ncbi:Hemolysin-type calcium-binding region [Roseobacter sp. AzwK-3b]|uniref:VWD domain-containing protein n=1 Tax=Roseobacter sp. AzwK-3b TaxID=351016 RepID=UPI0001569D25|nr:VWD domain-containing protein [Roseobacter sp. AzwK-3b]EDM71497.1 Hemolysin-type calcium-binding region [Roseobacter sp. AzwK-3b]
MSTFSISGVLVGRDPDDNAQFAQPVTLVIATPDTSTTVTYSIIGQGNDLPVVEFGADEARTQLFTETSGQFVFPLGAISFDAEIFGSSGQGFEPDTIALGQATTPQGTHVILELEYSLMGMGFADAIFVIGGDPAVFDATIEGLTAFENSITASGPIDATDPFGPGQALDLTTWANTVQGPLLIQGTDGGDLLYGSIGDDSIVSGDADSDNITASEGNDTIDLSGMNLNDAFALLDYRRLDAGITATIDGEANTGTIDKGINGVDTLVGVQNPMIAGFNLGGLSLTGTGFNDTFDITVPDDQWISVSGGGGADTYIVSGDGLVRLDFRNAVTVEENGNAQFSSGVSVDLAQGLVLDDGFGNQEVISGTGKIWEVRGTDSNDLIIGSAANESFILARGLDTLDAGDGFDRLRYDRFGVDGITADMEAGTVAGIWDNSLFAHKITNVEYLRGSNGDDVIGDSSGNDVLEGRSGSDFFILSGGQDIIRDFQIGVDNLEVSSPGLSTQQVQDAFAAAINSPDGAFVDFGNGSSVVFRGLSADQARALDPVEATNLGGPIPIEANQNVFIGTRLNDFIDTATSFGLGEAVIGTAGNDTIDMAGNDANDEFVTLDYRVLQDPVTVTIDGQANTGSVDKGLAGTDTLVGVATPLAAGWTNGGLAIVGTAGDDVFNLAPEGEQWISVSSTDGLDSFTLNGTGLVRMDFRDADTGINVNLGLASGQIIDDGFGNTETIGGSNPLWEVYGSFGDDSFTGSAGNESYRYAGGNNTLDGGDGFDRLRYDTPLVFGVDANLETGIVEISAFNLNDQRISLGTINSVDTVQGFEYVRGTFGSDTLTGDANDNRLEGRNGNDILVDGLGSDILIGGEGADFFTIVGGGNDVIDDFEIGVDILNVVIGGLSVADRNVALTSATDDGDGSAVVDFGNGNILTFRGLTTEDVASLAQDGPPPLPPSTTPVAWTVGDPHLLTLDGVGYDFHAVGEFVLLRAVPGNGFDWFEVQARTAPVEDVENVSVNVAVAARLSDGSSVMFDATDTNPVSIDGAVRLLGDGSVLTLETGDQIIRDGNIYTLVFAGTDGVPGVTAGDARLSVALQDGRLDLGVQISANMSGNVEGLLGDGDGNAANDIALADGTVLERPLAFDDLYGQYRDDWRVTTEEQSLFTYDAGESLEGFYDPDMPGAIVTADNFDPADVDAARAAVEAAGLTPGTVNFDNAVLDFLLTDDPTFIESSASELVRAPETATVPGKLDVGETRVTLDVTLTDIAGNAIGDAVVGFTTGVSTARTLAEETEGVGGSYNIRLGSGAAGRVDATKAYDAQTDPTIGVGDALDALRIALDINPSFGPATPQNLIAADMNGDGRVGVGDALDILRFALDVETDAVPRWVFVAPDAALPTDADNVFYDTGIDVASVTAGPVELTGILLGNIDQPVPA